MAMVADLTGKRALVTGGSRGIGRAIALALTEAGATVTITARQEEQLQATKRELEAVGGRCFTFSGDVSDPGQVARMARTTHEQIGGVDILVNNAGAAGSHKFLDHPDDLWHRMLAVNLTSVYYVSKAFAPGMVEQGWGRIINIASTASKAGGKYIAAYSAAKHGVLGLTRSLALELAPDVTVNAICPGYVDTPMTEATVENIVARSGMEAAAARATLEKTTPQRRLIQPDEVAAVALLLAQERSRGITGQAINVDGGAVMF